MAIEKNGKAAPIKGNAIDWEKISDPTSYTNHFEFWPSWTTHLPMWVCGIYYALKSRNIGFFALVNPAMANGGLYGYSKSAIMEQLRPANKPKSHSFSIPLPPDRLQVELSFKGIKYPIVCKPDVGARGQAVAVVHNHEGLVVYLDTQKSGNYTAEEFIDKCQEYGVFYVFDPEQQKPKIISLAKKIPLQVIGDGVHQVRQIAERHPRAGKYLGEIDIALMDCTPAEGELVRLSHIGNHCRGAVFLDYTSWIDDALANTFHGMVAHISGFNYGRFDVKVDHLHELWDATKIKVIEINGTNSEAAHIYSPGNNYFKAILTIAETFRMMNKIAKFNKTLGVRKTPFRELWHHFINR